MAQVGAPPPPLGPQTGMGPPARPHHAADPHRHRQHQHHHQHYKPRPPGGSAPAAAGIKQQKPSTTAGRPGAPATSAGQASAVVPAVAADGTAELERLRRDTPFMCTIRFKNDLPEIPGDPKLLVSRFEPDKLSSFFLTSIEQQPRRELLLPADAGVTISLMDLERFDVPVQQPGEPRRRLDPADEALLQDVDNLPSHGAAVSPLKVKRATRGANPSWLMATTYLTSTAVSAGRRGAAAAAAAGSSRFEMAQQQQELTREQQLADIDATFTAAQQQPRHPTKPNVTAVSCVPIFPEFDTWEDKYVTVTFEEGDPASESKTLEQVKDPALRAQLISRCMIKSYAPQSGSDPAMGLLVPRAAAAAAAQGEPIADACDVEELEGDYNWDCEYSFDLTTRDASKAPDTLLLVMHEDHVGYCQFDGQLKLRKRKRQEGDEPRPEKACIHNRDYHPPELTERANRRVELEEAYAAGYEEEQEGMEQDDEY